MELAQALGILEYHTPNIPTSLPNHRLIVEALGSIREALFPQPSDEEIKAAMESNGTEPVTT